MSAVVSELFDAEVWVDVPGFGELTDITYHQDRTGRIARVAFDRPEVRNAFRPHTVDELYRALDDARQNPKIGVVLLTGNGPSAKDGGWAFCSGGDQRIRGRDGNAGRHGASAQAACRTHGAVGFTRRQRRPAGRHTVSRSTGERITVRRRTIGVLSWKH